MALPLAITTASASGAAGCGKVDGETSAAGSFALPFSAKASRRGGPGARPENCGAKPTAEVVPDPAATRMYCRPPTSTVLGAPRIPEAVGYDQTFSPVSAR